MVSRKSADPGEPTEDVVQLWRQSLPDERMAHLIRVTSRGFARALQLRLSDHDISFGQWTFLRILWERDGLTQRELSVLAGLMEPTTHTAILRMEELGLVTRRHLPGNRKKLHIFLTDKGQALQDVLVPMAEETNTLASAGISKADIKTTRRTLLKMIENMAADEARAMDQGLRVASTREIGKRTTQAGETPARKPVKTKAKPARKTKARIKKP